MSFMSLWSTVNNIASITLGGTRQRKQFIMSCGGEKLTLPVTPNKYSVKTSELNKVVDILDFGEALLFGNPGLVRLSFSCFFPRLYHEYTSIISGDYEKDATELVELITKWKEGKKPVRVIITDSPVNHMLAIKQFDYDEHDGSHDIYYTMSLEEYKDLNTPAANNDKQVDDTTGLKERPTTETPPSTKPDKLKRARDVLEMSKKAYGTVSKWRAIAESNDMKDLAINNLGKLRIPP